MSLFICKNLASYVIPGVDLSSFMVVEKTPIRSCLQKEVDSRSRNKKKRIKWQVKSAVKSAID